MTRRRPPAIDHFWDIGQRLKWKVHRIDFYSGVVRMSFSGDKDIIVVFYNKAGHIQTVKVYRSGLVVESYDQKTKDKRKILTQLLCRSRP